MSETRERARFPVELLCSSPEPRADDLLRQDHAKTVWGFLAWFRSMVLDPAIPPMGDESLTAAIREFSHQRDAVLREFGVSAAGSYLIEPLPQGGNGRPFAGSSADPAAEVRVERFGERPEPVEPEEGCLCQECGRRYRVDLMLPDEIWEMVRPEGKEGEAGLLCGACIMVKLEGLRQFGYLLSTQGSVGGSS